ncbi:MAG: archease [Candidatus Geothermarchaeota archaeon]
MVGWYNYLDHMSDVIIEAYGGTLEEAFKYAGIGFYDLIVDVDKIEEKVKEEIHLDGYDLEELLYNWIEALILSLELKNLVFKEFEVKINRVNEKYVLHAIGYGESYDKRKHGYKTHVKAVTFHQMVVCKRGELYYLRYLVDL